MKALVVEDDRFLSGNICESIKHLFITDQAYGGKEGIHYIHQNIYDIVILDIMMPEINGYEVLKEMRSNGIETPVLILTALDQPADKINGLNAGADDYLSKPFDIGELIARLENLMRRTKTGYSKSKLEFLDMEICLSTRSVKIGEKRLDVRGKLYELLEYLVTNKNIIVHKERVFLKIWGFYSSTDFSVVEVYISQLRKELKKFGYDKYLKTVRGLGYILTDDSRLYE